MVIQPVRHVDRERLRFGLAGRALTHPRIPSAPWPRADTVAVNVTGSQPVTCCGTALDRCGATPSRQAATRQSHQPLLTDVTS